MALPGSSRLLWGKVRRFWLAHFRPGYVRRQASRRRGRCARCGGCCSLGLRCPWLSGTNHCTIYERRPIQCRLFPIDERDLRDAPTCPLRFVPAASEEKTPS